VHSLLHTSRVVMQAFIIVISVAPVSVFMGNWSGLTQQAVKESHGANQRKKALSVSTVNNLLEVVYKSGI
jgi:hypothetical protein